jgi:hypothetical protein
MDSVAETALQIAIANGNAIFPDSNKKNIKFFEGTAMLLKQSGSEELVGCKWIIGPILTCSIPLITLYADLLVVNAFHLKSAPQINYYAFKFYQLTIT